MLSLFHVFPPYPLIVLLFFNTFQSTNSTLIDDFREHGPLNNRDLPRTIFSANIDTGVHLGILGYVCESIATDNDPTDLHSKALKIIYTTDEIRSCQLSAGLRTEKNSLLSHELEFTVNPGARNEVDISFKKFNCAHVLTSEIIITADMITIHEIHIIDDTEINWPEPHNQPVCPSTFAPNLRESALVLDDFRQWRYAINALKGPRIIASINPQHPGLAILPSSYHLIEYFPTQLAFRNYSLLRITYSTSTMNRAPYAVKKRVGMVLRSDDKEIRSFFFDWELQKGKRVELHISIKFLIQLSHEFRIGSNLGIIIRGPLKIYQIEFLSANNGDTEIPCQIPASNVDIQEMIKNRKLFINIPIICASKVNEPEHLLDDFMQWHNPTNLHGGNRVITAIHLQHPGIAILLSSKEYLIEYFSTAFANMNSSLLCITYSTSALNKAVCTLVKRVGIVLKSHDKEIWSFFFDWKLQKGQRVKLHISIKFLIQLMCEFQIGSNLGIIIRGPLKIHHIKVLTTRNGEPKIPFQIPASDVDIKEMIKNQRLFRSLPVITVSKVRVPPLVHDDFIHTENHTSGFEGIQLLDSMNPQHKDIALKSPEFFQSTSELDGHRCFQSDSEMDNQACSPSLSEIDTQPAPVTSTLELEYEEHGLSLFDLDNQGTDHFPSHSNSLNIWPRINNINIDDRPYKFKLKYIQFQNNLYIICIKEAFILDVHVSNVLRGSYEKMDPNSFSKILNVHVQFDFLDDSSPNPKFYFELLHNEILAADNHLFEPAGNMLYRIIPKLNVDPGVLDYYRFVGRAMGMGIVNNVTQLTKFVPMVYKILLNKPVLHSDLVLSYPSLLTDIEQTLKFASSNPEFLSSMSIPNSDNYAHINVILELIHNSQHLMVPMQNTDEYVSALLWQYAQQVIGAQAEALCNGLNDVIPMDKLSVFDEDEFVHILMGCPEGHEYLPTLKLDL